MGVICYIQKYDQKLGLEQIANVGSAVCLQTWLSYHIHVL